MYVTIPPERLPDGSSVISITGFANANNQLYQFTDEQNALFLHNTGNGPITLTVNGTSYVVKARENKNLAFELDSFNLYAAEPTPFELKLWRSRELNKGLSRSSLFLSVEDFGIIGDGVTDQTSKIQELIEYVSANGGGKIYFPPGTYIVNALAMKSNVELEGTSWKAIIKQKERSFYAITANRGTAGTSNPDDNIKNIAIRNLQIVGNIETEGFAEHEHAVNLNAVTNAVVDNCKIVGWKGDGIYFGSGNQAGLERHNQNVKVTNCVFDGVNNGNRNGVSIIDCDGAIIEKNEFIRCSRADMPGAIDIEPNAYAFAITRNITIRDNIIKDCLSNGVAVVCRQDLVTTKSKNITIYNNTMKNVQTGVRVYDFAGIPANDKQSTTLNLTIQKNHISNAENPFVIFNIFDVKLLDNTFEYCTHSAFLSNPENATHRCVDVEMKNNTFYRIGTVSNVALEIGRVLRLNAELNRFFDTGIDGQNEGTHVLFRGSYSQNVKFRRNTFAGQKVSHIIRAENHIFDTIPENRFEDNPIIDGALNDFKYSRSINEIRVLEVNSLTPDVNGGFIYKTQNTGLTEITNFINGIDGQELTILFADNNTTIKDNVVSGNGIRLEGRTDFKAKVNDVLRLIRIDFVWREVSRSLAPTTKTAAVFTDLSTTPSVKDNTVFRTQNTAPTTITNLLDGYDGQMITILFADNNTTLIDNVNLGVGIRLADRASFTGKINDTITLVRVEFVWREVNRSRLPSNRTISVMDVNSATPSVKLDDAYKTQNTQATTITNFVDGYEGQEITILFADNFTTINNGVNAGVGIKLLNNVSWTATVNDTLTLIRMDNVWREKSRTVM